MKLETLQKRLDELKKQQAYQFQFAGERFGVFAKLKYLEKRIERLEENIRNKS